VAVCAVHGNFDDCQTGVKNVFAACREKELPFALSSANSINIGRLAPQIMYYFRSYRDLVDAGTITLGDEVNFSVPTGNFGDILAGYFAKLLGLPVGKLICASNANNVLTDFIRTGTYDRMRPLYKTNSPSMDILVSSNLERLLYLLSGDCDLVASLMKQLNEQGFYTVPDSLKAAIDAEFWADYAGDGEAFQTIRKVFNSHQYLCDTHTAVGLSAAKQYVAETGDDRPMVVASTASPYKFAADVLASLGQEVPADQLDALDALTAYTGVEIPYPLRGLGERKIRFEEVCDRNDMVKAVFAAL
jgi:threonine synthase